MKRLDSLTTYQIITNVILVIMIGLVCAGMMMDSQGSFGLKKNKRAQINQVCIETGSEWDECIGFGERALVEISEQGSIDLDGEVILIIRKVQQ